MVMPVADALVQKGMIHDEVYSNIQAARTSQDQMRELYKALRSGGSEVKCAFYRTLQENEPHLVKDLGGTLARSKINDCCKAKYVLGKKDKQVQKKLKASLQSRFGYVFEGTVEDELMPLNSIYTALYITQGEREGVNREHEIRQIEYPHRGKTSSDIPIHCSDLFKSRSKQDRHIKTVLTKGIAGIGKTISVQKFILDWVEGKFNQDIDFIFVLPFRELNLIKDKQYSLQELLNYFHPELKEITDGQIYSESKVLFIFDGLDESKLPFDFTPNEKLSDHCETSSVDVLLTNLLQGNLLPNALLWITSRPAAADQIPRKMISLVAEVRGFTDQQKEDYFKKIFSDDPIQANKIISYVNKTRSLQIMCHLPVMCWIAAKVIEHVLIENPCVESLTTLTEMYTHFLLIQTQQATKKYQGGSYKDPQNKLLSSQEIILKLAKLAFEQLEKGNVIFYEEDLTKCGIDIDEAAVYSGLCTEILKQEYGLYNKKVLCFVHLSFQEFLAALYVFHCCVGHDIDALNSFMGEMPKDMPLHMYIKRVVVKASESKNGHLDLFLRFLLGIAQESIKALLHGLLQHKENCTETVEEMRKYLRGPDVQNISPERRVNLFLCLTEMKDKSVILDIHNFFMSTTRDKKDLSIDHCSSLANALLMSNGTLDEMDIRKYCIPDRARNRLVPAVRKCKKAILSGLILFDEVCESLANILQSPNSPLRELHLWNCRFYGSDELSVLFDAMSGPHCKLKILRLTCFRLGYKDCESLASLLKSADSPVRELELSFCRLPECQYTINTTIINNNPLMAIFDAIGSQHCKLKILTVNDCCLTKTCHEMLAIALSSNSNLRKLELSNSKLCDSGVKLLSDGLKSPHCRLETLKLQFCRVTEEGCALLASALSVNPSYLKELDLSYNHPGDAGVKLMLEKLVDPNNQLREVNTDHNEEIWIVPKMLKRYACDLMLDPDTAHRHLSLFDGNRKVKLVRAESESQRLCPDHPDRFDDWEQVLCKEGLTGRCYWEVRWEGLTVHTGVAYKSINKKGKSRASRLGFNNKSWCLDFSSQYYTVRHIDEVTVVGTKSFLPQKVGVYLDWPSGTLSFYEVSSDTVAHLFTFYSTFTEPLYPAFGLDQPSTVCLCQIK
ncbi:protein NLRC3-like [Aplochiton taeniatus]